MGADMSCCISLVNFTEIEKIMQQSCGCDVEQQKTAFQSPPTSLVVAAATETSAADAAACVTAAAGTAVVLARTPVQGLIKYSETKKGLNLIIS